VPLHEPEIPKSLRFVSILGAMKDFTMSLLAIDPFHR
jgi:hypothetical protein